MALDWTGIVVGILALAAGGVLKGAAGVGAPIIAVPLLAWFYGVPVAITLFALPNLMTNGWQAFQYRKYRAPAGLTWAFAIAGLFGAGTGTVILVSVSSEILLIAMAVVIFIYIAFRLARPHWSLPLEAAKRLSLPAGFLGGILFGATGVSAPVSVTFLSAIRLRREEFIATISIFFGGMALPQIPILIASGVMTPWLALASALAVLPMWAGMPLGEILARFVSARMFDRIILILLALIALRLVLRALF